MYITFSLWKKLFIFWRSLLKQRDFYFTKDCHSVYDFRKKEQLLEMQDKYTKKK